LTCLPTRRAPGPPLSRGDAPRVERGLGRLDAQDRAMSALLGAAEAVCAELGTALPVASAEEYWRTVHDARGALGEEAFAAAWAEGGALTLEQAIAFALEELPDG
jgi:hypothetical protein